MTQSSVHFDCPICQSKDHDPLYEDTLKGERPRFNYDFSLEHTLTYRLVRCKQCQHVYATPRHPSIWEEYQSVVDSAYLARKEERVKSARKVLKRIRRHISEGRLLDVGCATGDFISEADSFFEAEGLELSRWSHGLSQERGLTVHKTLLEDLKVDALYDVVTLWGVIEHFEFPKKEVGHISRVMNSGGYVCLWTGDFDSLPSKLLGKKWWYHQGQHIQMFTQKSLTKLFNDCGFETVEISWYPYVMSMQSIYTSLGRYPKFKKFVKPLLTHPFFAPRKITLSFPGEMFAIFRKK